MSILEPVRRPFDDVEEVGVVIHNTNHGRHTGFLYRGHDGRSRVLHLAFHHMLRDETSEAVSAAAKQHYGADLRWAELGLPEDSKIVFAAHLSQVALGNERIPYGLDASGTAFTDDGEFIPGPIGKGLTCATFITAVLKGYGHPVVADDWPQRPDDVEWANGIIRLMAGRASDDHIEAVRLDIGNARYRPEEVVGAATLGSDEWPAQFQDAFAVAKEVLNDLA